MAQKKFLDLEGLKYFTQQLGQVQVVNSLPTSATNSNTLYITNCVGSEDKPFLNNTYISNDSTPLYLIFGQDNNVILGQNGDYYQYTFTYSNNIIKINTFDFVYDETNNKISVNGKIFTWYDSSKNIVAYWYKKYGAYIEISNNGKKEYKNIFDFYTRTEMDNILEGVIREITLSSTATTVEKSGSTVTIPTIAGPKGDTGNAGPQGEKGEKGDTGEPGPQGEKGDNGTNGVNASITSVTSTTTTLDSSQDASVTVTKNGTDLSCGFEFNFNIPKGAKGDTGAKGEAGEDGGKWYFGTAISGTNTVGLGFLGSGIVDAHKGDMYLNTSNSNVYNCVVGGDVQAARWIYTCNIKGDSGSSGSSGSDGTNAEITGATATATTVASNNSATANVSLTGTESKRGFNFTFQIPKGDKGESGTNGTNGTNGRNGGIWYYGTGVTGTSTTATIFTGSGVASAVVGDMFLNTSNSNVYKCTTAGAASAAKWTYVCNIKGATGAKGDTGTSTKISSITATTSYEDIDYDQDVFTNYNVSASVSSEGTDSARIYTFGFTFPTEHGNILVYKDYFDINNTEIYWLPCSQINTIRREYIMIYLKNNGNIDYTIVLPGIQEAQNDAKRFLGIQQYMIINNPTPFDVNIIIEVPDGRSDDVLRISQCESRMFTLQANSILELCAILLPDGRTSYDDLHYLRYYITWSNYGIYGTWN